MPTYRSITISLVSQFDILTIPEYAPPLNPNDPFSPSPTLINTEKSLVSIYIPTYPSSQFWLSYCISPPHPPNALYYFKLFLNGSCVVSWGCGAEDGYKGKTMFGLFDSEQSWFGEHGTEKRVFCFAREHRSARRMRSDNLGDVMEVKVYRSKGRQRTAPEMTQFKDTSLSDDPGSKGPHQNIGGGINFVNGGIAPYKHPRRFYKYALFDPLDEPFATFRYYYRTWDELESIGVISPEPSTATASLHTTDNNSIAASREQEEDPSESDEALTFPTAVDNALPLKSAVEIDANTAASTSDGTRTELPPTARFAPASHPTFPASPDKCISFSQASSSLAERSSTPIPESQRPPKPKSPSSRKSSRKRTPIPDPIDHPSRFSEWLRRTPSPVEREIEKQWEDATSSEKLRRNASMGMLKGVVAAAVKRKGRRSEG